MDQKVHDLISKYLGDLYALESHGLEALTGQVNDLKKENQPNALRACQNFQLTIQAHVNDLEARLKVIGASPASGVKSAVTAAAGTIAGVYNAVRSEPTSKAIRDDYAFLSLDAISHLMLHTTALSLGDVETANLADRGYRDCARMIMEIDKIMPELVLEELGEDKLAPKAIAEECHHLISDSWNRQAASMGMK
jgi:ferritin-like metal-binding protein YciE